MIIEQYIELDQVSERTAGWQERIIEKYDLRNRPSVELHDRQVCIPFAPPISSKVDSAYISNDRLVEFIVDNKLLALQYQRRDEFNYTEVTNVEYPEALEPLNEKFYTEQKP